MNVNDMSIDEVAKELEADVILGDQCADFIKSDIGQYCIRKAAESVVELRYELEDIETPLRKVNELRLQIKSQQQATNWIVQAVAEGKAALHHLELQQSED